MPILGICSLQAIGDDSRHIASLTFYPGICRAENFSTAETQYHSSSISSYVCTYVQVHFNPSPSSPRLAHLTPRYTSQHITISFLLGSFPSFRESTHSIPFHSIPLPICACQAFPPFRLTRLYLYPVPSCGRQTVYIRKMYVYKVEPIGCSVQFLQQYSWAPAHGYYSKYLTNRLSWCKSHTDNWARPTRKSKLEIKSNSTLSHTPVATHPVAHTSKAQII